MKETDTPRWYGYLQALGRDPWVDWGVTAGFLLLIMSWFLPGAAADFVIYVVCMAIFVGIAVRIGYVIACVRLGHRSHRESVRAVRFRNVMGNIVVVLYFVVAILLIVWRYLNS